MRSRVATLIVLMAIVLVGSWSFATVSAQSDDQRNPTTVRISEIVQQTLSLAIPLEDGEILTTTVPVSVSVELEIDLEQDAGTSQLPLQSDYTFSIEDAFEVTAKLSDMPAGFIAVADEPVPAQSNEELALQFTDPEGTEAELDSLGRIGGYLSSFENAQFSMLAGGNVVINCSVIIFSDDEGAEEYLRSAMDREKQRVESPVRVRPMSVSSFGQSSIGFVGSFEASGDTPAFSQNDIWMRIENMVVILQSRSLNNTANIDQMEEVMLRLEERAVSLVGGD